MVKKAVKGFFPLFTTFIIVFIFLFSVMTMVVTASDLTAVLIDPTSQTVSAGNVVIRVNCIPERPVKAFELKASFNPSLLQATSVLEGDFFNGYTTFFNPGTINNQAGTIINIYDLIVGPGNVTQSGSFVSITFTAGSISGTTTVSLYDVWVTNETEYIDVSVTSGSVTVVGGSSPPNEPPSSPLENESLFAPVKPTGPTFIEIDTPYVYNSSAVDPKGGSVRLRFDWGDGSLSNWSDFIASNSSVSFSYTWYNVSTYLVRAMAQDENFSNSSWSAPLTVMISKAESGNLSPIATFVIPLNVSSNQTVLFNASGCTDPDGIIMSYLWDFGDGTQGTGKTPTHMYQVPGQYMVTLTVTDNSGLTNSISQFVVVSEKALGETTEVVAFSPSYLTLLLLVCIIGALLGFIVVFRDPFRTMLSQRTLYPSRSTIVSSDVGIAEIEQILDSLFLEMENNALPLGKDTLLDSYCDVIIENVEANARVRLPNLNIAEVEKIVDERYHSKIGEKIDKL